MNDSRDDDVRVDPKPPGRAGGQFGSRRTGGLRPRLSTHYESTLPDNLLGGNSPEANPATIPPGTVPLRWPDHR